MEAFQRGHTPELSLTEDPRAGELVLQQEGQTDVRPQAGAERQAAPPFSPLLPRRTREILPQETEVLFLQFPG